MTARDIGMVEHDLSWHRLAANGQAMDKRCAFGRNLIAPVDWPIDGSSEGYRQLELVPLIICHHVGRFPKRWYHPQQPSKLKGTGFCLGRPLAQLAPWAPSIVRFQPVLLRRLLQSIVGEPGLAIVHTSGTTT